MQYAYKARKALMQFAMLSLRGFFRDTDRIKPPDPQSIGECGVIDVWLWAPFFFSGEGNQANSMVDACLL